MSSDRNSVLSNPDAEGYQAWANSSSGAPEHSSSPQNQIRMTAIDDDDEFSFDVAPVPAAVLRSPVRNDRHDPIADIATPKTEYADSEVVSPAKSLRHLAHLVSEGEPDLPAQPAKHASTIVEGGYLSPMADPGASPNRMVRSESEIQYFGENAQYYPPELANIVEYNEEEIHHPVPVSGQAEIIVNPNSYFADDDPVNDPSDEEIDPDTVLEDSSRAVGFGNIIQPTKMDFRASDEPNAELSAQYPDAVFYPAPVPAQLRLPPLLSRRKNKAAQWRRRKSSRVFDALISADDQSVWGITPLNAELTAIRMAENGEEYTGETDECDDLDSVAPDSDSERATIISDTNSYQDLGSIYGDGANPSGKSNQFKRKSKFWAQKGWQSFTHKRGEPEEPGDDDDGIGELNDEFRLKDDDLAFTRYDKHVIDQHTKLFQSGGVYGSLRNGPQDGNPPSLLEEIEIRRQGRKIQRQVMVNESDMLEASRHSAYAHPVDQVHQPSLLELDSLAQHDYLNRQAWHKEATSKVTNRAHPDESLKQRRLRIKNERSKTATEPPQESLAARRARLRKSRQPPMPNTITQTSMAGDSVSVISVPEKTPPTPHEEFDMVRAVALHM